LKNDSKIHKVERFCKTVNKNGSMPAVWRKLSIEGRHAVVTIIDNFIASTHEGKTA
jgi:hypothetical protein